MGLFRRREISYLSLIMSDEELMRQIKKRMGELGKMEIREMFGETDLMISCAIANEYLAIFFEALYLRAKNEGRCLTHLEQLAADGIERLLMYNLSFVDLEYQNKTK